MYRIKREAENADGDEYYLVLDELQDLEGWYPLDRFIWEDDPEPDKEDDLRKIINCSFDRDLKVGKDEKKEV